MPQKQASIKSLRQSKKRTTRSKQAKSRIKDTIKNLDNLISEKKIDEAKLILSKVAKMLDKATKRNIIALNKARRVKSRLAKRVVNK